MRWAKDVLFALHLRLFKYYDSDPWYLEHRERCGNPPPGAGDHDITAARCSVIA